MRTGQIEKAAIDIIKWEKMVGRVCNFKHPHSPSPDKDRGTIQGTNGLQGDEAQVIITDRVGNNVYIPVNMAATMIELLQG